ncbi:MAG: hypothetical protein ACYDA3_00905 [Gaiellaceae bacterium]
MDTYRVVLTLHLFSLLLGFGAGTVIYVCLIRLRAAQTLEAAAPWGMLAGQTEKVFPIAILGLFATGAYMTSDLWTWGTGWIDVAIAVLLILGVQGGGIAARRAHALKEALTANGPGPLGPEARALTRDKLLWVTSFTNPFIVLATVWNMTDKPSAWASIASVVVAYVIGAAIALAFTRAPTVAVAAVGESAS